MSDERYTRLRAAVVAYDKAIRAYGILGSQWVDDSEHLDALYKALLRAADIDYPETDQPADQVHNP